MRLDCFLELRVLVRLHLQLPRVLRPKLRDLELESLQVLDTFPLDQRLQLRRRPGEVASFVLLLFEQRLGSERVLVRYLQTHPQVVCLGLSLCRRTLEVGDLELQLLCERELFFEGPGWHLRRLLDLLGLLDRPFAPARAHQQLLVGLFQLRDFLPAPLNLELDYLTYPTK